MTSGSANLAHGFGNPRVATGVKSAAIATSALKARSTAGGNQGEHRSRPRELESAMRSASCVKNFASQGAWLTGAQQQNDNPQDEDVT